MFEKIFMGAIGHSGDRPASEGTAPAPSGTATARGSRLAGVAGTRAVGVSRYALAHARNGDVRAHRLKRRQKASKRRRGASAVHIHHGGVMTAVPSTGRRAEGSRPVCHPSTCR